MMRNKLQKFTDFANGLLPHETEYLLSIQAFEDEERLIILERVNYNAHHIKQFTPYDQNIDKRKYNHLQNWIKTRLAVIDADQQFTWIHKMEEKIMTDSILPQEERALMRAVKNYEHPWHFFTAFYEMLDQYRHFLLIRMRYSDHELINEFIIKYRDEFVKARNISDQMHSATIDIVGQYAGQSVESIQWKDWLADVFYNEEQDGLNRYMALVRLVFIAHNYKSYDLLREMFDYLESRLALGINYSKRLLLNFYNNRLMMHTHFREFEAAIKYGYLSIRHPSHDHLLYVNNLCAVLLRQHANQEALELMQKIAPESRKTKNMHNRIGFVSFYMEALIKNGQFQNAARYGDSFLNAYHKEVLKFRWHLFFSILLESLLYLENFSKITRLIKKFDLLSRDEKYKSKSNYSPIIPLLYHLSLYKEGETSQEEFEIQLRDMNIELKANEFIRSSYQRVLTQIKKFEAPSPSNQLRTSGGTA